MSSLYISIIIPVFNSYQFLSQCLNSVIFQDFRDIEIIIVNDGSTDESLSLCQKYANKDKRIIIIDKIDNIGVEKARWEGLKRANGKYILFMDADDWLDNKFVLKDLYETAESFNADYVEIGCQRVLDSNKWFKSKFSTSPPLIVSQPNLFKDYFISFFGVNKLSVNIWGKLYRRSTIDKANIKPLGLCMGEDLAFNLQLFPHLSKIILLNQPGYNYRIGGMTSQYNPHFLQDMKKLFYFKEEMIKKYDYKEAIPFTRYELKNVLKSEICQLIIYKRYKKDELIRRISDEINDPIYKHLYDIHPLESFWGSPFVIAFKNKDAKQLYEICNNIVLKGAPKRILKKIAFNVLNVFN